MSGFKNLGLDLSRRDFMKAAAGLSAAVLATRLSGAYAQGNDTIKVGLIGAGGRGLYDTTNCLKAAPGVELVAIGDLLKDRLDATLAALKEKFPDKVKVTAETSFVGFDSYQKVIDAGVDLVILTAVPHFRPQHFKAAVEAGKHVFMEKPVAVDPVGVRSIIASAEIADQKKLKVVAGTQARRMNHRIELMKRIQDGEIGDIVAAQCIRTGDAMRDWGVKERTPQMSDMEWEIRRWLFHTWLSGDFVAEMHVHELDIMNWAMGGPPTKCVAFGGRQVRTDKELFGDVYDHFNAELEYPNGARVTYVGAQIDKVPSKTYERIIGTKGSGYTDWAGSKIEKEGGWSNDKEKDNDPVIQQHADHIAAIRNDTPLNEAKRIAESTLTAILVRMSAYTGRELKFEWALKASQLDLTPPVYELASRPPVEIAMPGITELV